MSVAHLILGLNRNARGGAGHLHDVAPKGLSAHEGAQQAHNTAAPEQSHLDRVAVLQHIHERHDSVVREVCVADGITGFVEHLLMGQLDHLQVGLQSRKVLGLQGCQEPVRAVFCLRSVGHGHTLLR
nr:hypothetical protein [Microvirga aerophila]